MWRLTKQILSSNALNELFAFSWLVVFLPEEIKVSFKEKKRGGRKEERKEKKIKPHPADYIQISDITAKMGKSL